MNALRERIIPLFITAFFYYLAYYLLSSISTPYILLQFVYASFWAVSITLFITGFWKVSAHMVGIGGLTGLLLVLNLHYYINLFIPFISVILLSGFLGFARLKLKAHTSVQIYVGYGIGVFVVFFFLYFGAL